MEMKMENGMEKKGEYSEPLMGQSPQICTVRDMKNVIFPLEFL